MSDLVVGLDLGGTQIRAVLADAAGTVLARHNRLTEAHEGPRAVLDRIYATIAAVMPDGGVAAIGVGAPGPTDPYQGIVLMGPNLPGWRNVNLRQLLGDHFQTPVFVGNDANVAGLAEHRYGAGQGVRHMVYITVSTGIGTGVIVDNRLLLGRQGLAAEIGHMTIDAWVENGVEAGSGYGSETQAGGADAHLIGTLEGLASGPNLAKRAQAALAAGAQSAVLKLAMGKLEAVTPRLLNQAARDGDPFALEQFQITGRYLGIGITNILHIFNPERIVLGGGVWMHAQELMAETMWATIRSRAQSPEYWQELSVVSAALGDDVGLLGAVALAHDGLSGTRVA
ncbi:MAG: ROK family protein [Caldilineaceae bacterium]|nr:ROK family protein [Caldilineaceae bacterium]